MVSPPQDEKNDYLSPTRTASTADESAVRFDANLASRDDGSPLSRKCSLLLETPSGAEYRSEKQDSATASSSSSVISQALSTSRIAGPRPSVAKWMCIGGWQQQLTVVGCFMLMFNSWGLVNAYGTYQSYYKQHIFTETNTASLNLVGAMQCFIVLTLSIFVGRILDAGHFYRLTITGAILVTLASFLLSLRAITSRYAYVLLTQGVLKALGMSCMFVPSSQIVATWFVKWKILFMGVVASGASIAGLIYPMMLKHLIALVGFHQAQRYVSIVTALTSLISIAFAVPNPERIIRQPRSWLNSRTYLDGNCFRRTPSLGLVIGIGLMFTGFYAVFFNLEDWAGDTGLGRLDATPASESVQLKAEVPEDAIRTFWLLSIMNACSTIGRVGVLFIGNFAGALRTHAVVSFIAAILLLAMWTTATTVQQGLAFVIMYGIVSGADIALPPSSMADILGEDPEEKAKLGQWTGIMYACAAPFALAGPVIGGLLVGAGGLGYLPLQLWCGFAIMLSGAFMAWASWFHYPYNTLRRWTSSSNDMV